MGGPALQAGLSPNTRSYSRTTMLSKDTERGGFFVGKEIGMPRALKELLRIHGDSSSKNIDVVRAANQLLAVTELILNNQTLERFDKAASKDFAFSDRGVAIQYSMTVLVYYVMVEAVYDTVSEIFTVNSYN